MRNTIARSTLLILFTLGANSPILASENLEAAPTNTSNQSVSADPCERDIPTLDRNALSEDADQARLDILTSMIRNSSECLRALGEKTAFSGGKVGGTGQGAAGQNSGGQGGTNQGGGSTSDPATAVSSNNPASLMATTTLDPASLNDSTKNAIPEPHSKGKESTLEKFTKNVNSAMNILNPTNVPFSSHEEVVFDDYSAQIYEAYQMEQDPVLKEALGEELARYAKKNKE